MINLVSRGKEKLPYCFSRSSIKFQCYTGQKVGFGYSLGKITRPLYVISAINWYVTSNCENEVVIHITIIQFVSHETSAYVEPELSTKHDDLWGECTSHCWSITHHTTHKASNADADLWSFLCCFTEQAVVETAELLIFWDTVLLSISQNFHWPNFHFAFLAATKQLYEWYFLSVCPSVCPSHLFDYVSIIVSSWNFQELSPRTRVTSMQKVKGQGHRGNCNSSLISPMGTKCCTKLEVA